MKDAQIRALKPAGKRRTVSLKDGTGLSIRVETNGRKVWVVRRSGKLSTIGDYPDVSLADARKLAGEAIQPTSFGAIWDQWFVEQIVPNHKRPVNASNLKAVWSPIWTRRVDTLTRAELVALLRKLKARAPSRAIRATSQLRAVLNFALALGLVDVNPMLGVPLSITAGRPKKRDRVLSDDEIRALWQMRSQGGAAGLHARFAMFALATLCRRGEVASARRSWIDSGVLSFPSSVMKSGRDWSVPLSQMALDQIPPSNGDLLFDVKAETTEAFIRRCDFVSGWSLHDLRRTGATRLALLGVLPHVVSRCLDHAVGSQADAHYFSGDLYRSERIEAMRLLSDHLRDVVQP